MVTAEEWRARVLDEIDTRTGEIVAALEDLVGVPSVTGSDAEHDAQAQLAAALGRDGLEVDHWELPLADLVADPEFPGVEVPRREAWGVVGRLPGAGDGPSLLLAGHVDVVPPGDRGAWEVTDPFACKVDRTVAYGRGTCDMKAGLVAARFAALALRAAGVPLRGDVLVAGVEGEEDGGLGAFGLVRRGWRADACVVPEPTSLGVVPACAGALTFRLTVHGLATHAARRADGVSAFEKFLPVWSALADLERRRNHDVHPLFRRWAVPYALSIGKVRVGDWPSSVPDLLVAEGRIGVTIDETPADARAALEAAVATACAGDDWLRANPVEVEWWGGQYAPGRLPAGSDLVERVAAAHRVATTGGDDREPDVWGAPYGSDLRLLTGLGGIPTVHYGPGDATFAHGPDEFVPLAEVTATARTLAALAVDTCGVA